MEASKERRRKQVVLVNRPGSAGSNQDAYEALEGVFGGSDFSQQEAITAICQTLQVSAVQAENILANLGREGCTAE